MRWSMLCFPHIFSGRVSHFILHIILVISLVTLFSFRIYFFEDSGTSEVWEQASGACISCSLTKYNLFPGYDDRRSERTNFCSASEVQKSRFVE
jgi:hypothetical protein